MKNKWNSSKHSLILLKFPSERNKFSKRSANISNTWRKKILGKRQTLFKECCAENLTLHYGGVFLKEPVIFRKWVLLVDVVTTTNKKKRKKTIKEEKKWPRANVAAEALPFQAEELYISEKMEEKRERGRERERKKLHFSAN